MNHSRSKRLFRRAKSLLPGGVNSPVRAYRSVGMDPPFLRRGKGAHVWDVDGNRYIDYVGSWGPLILGHADARILGAIRKAARDGTSFGAPTELEIRLAELVHRMMPSVEVVRMVNSGTEATMSAIRLARAYTGREKIIKFEGCYHGHADPFLVRAGSGAMTLGTPDSPGVPAATAAGTLNATFNEIGSVRSLFVRHRGNIAAVIVEPVAGNMGCVPPQPGFLQELRSICTREKTVFIMDEVMTGFRLARGGAQERYGVVPDLTTLGKIIGGGLPVGAYGGRRSIMKMIAPSGPVYQAGTLSGNPLAMAAGYEMLRLLSSHSSWYQKLEQSSAALASGIEDNLSRLGLNYSLNRVGSMFTLFFTDRDVTDFASAATSDRELFSVYFREMLKRGVYLPPSQFEAAFVSMAHTDQDIERTIKANRKALEAM